MIVRTLGRSHPDNGGSDASDHGTNRNNGRAESHKCREVPTVDGALSPAAYEASYDGTAINSETRADNMIIVFAVLISNCEGEDTESSQEPRTTARRAGCGISSAT